MASNTVNISFTGKQLIEAVQAVADEPVVKKDLLDDEDVFVLGQKSSYPYEQIAILIDGDNQVNPTKQYRSVTITEGEWPGLAFAIGYGPEDVVDAVKAFSQAIETKLIELGAVKLDRRDITFVFENQKYTCPAEAYDRNRIVLSDGRILSAGAWLESMPPKPQGLHVVGDTNAVVATEVA